MISIKNLYFKYNEKTPIFTNFNAEFTGTTAIFGPSGSGKTTLLLLVLGLLPPDSGTVICSNKFSAVFQEDRLLPFYTVCKNLILINKDKDKIINMLESLKVGETLYKKPKSLSGGQQRRVAIARALLADFDILVLDEPFTGLDKEAKKIKAEAINKHTKNKTVLLVTHSHEDAALLEAKSFDLV